MLDICDTTGLYILDDEEEEVDGHDEDGKGRKISAYFQNMKNDDSKPDMRKYMKITCNFIDLLEAF